MISALKIAESFTRAPQLRYNKNTETIASTPRLASLLRVYARVVQTSALKIAESFTRALNSGESSEDKKSETVASLLVSMQVEL